MTGHNEDKGGHNEAGGKIGCKRGNEGRTGRKPSVLGLAQEQTKEGQAAHKQAAQQSSERTGKPVSE